MRHILQCEGCPEPLSSYLDEYDAGKVSVAWTLCSYHARGVKYLNDPDAAIYPEDLD
jgi:hypothetical protein